MNAPSNDLDAATKAYVDSVGGASVNAGHIAFGDSDGEGLEGSGDLMFYESGRAFIGASTPLLALSGALALGSAVPGSGPGLVLNFGGTNPSGSISVSGPLIVSSSSGSVAFVANGTEYFGIEDSSSDVILSSSVSDKDMIFKVNDGGTSTEVFRLDGDVSALLVAGDKKVNFGDAGTFIHQASDGVLKVYSDTTLQLTGANVTAKADTTLTLSGGAVTANAVGTLTLSGNAISLEAKGGSGVIETDSNFTSSLGLTIDSDGTTTGGGKGLALGAGLDFKMFVASDDAYLMNQTTDKDIIFNANVDGTATEIARVDGSASSILIASDNKIEFGDTGTFIHQSSDGVLTALADTTLTLSGNAVTAFAAATLTLSGNAISLEAKGGAGVIETDSQFTSSLGIAIDADGTTTGGGKGLALGAGLDFKAFVASDDAYLMNQTSGKDLVFSLNVGGTQTSVLTLDANGNAGGAAAISIPAATAVIFGANTNFLSNNGSNGLLITSNDDIDIDSGAGGASKNVTIGAGGNNMITVSATGTEFVAGKNAKFSGVISGAAAQFAQLPSYMNQSFQYVSSSETLPTFGIIRGNSNFGIIHKNDAASIGGTSSAFIVSGSPTSVFNTGSFDVYLNGIRLMKSTGSTTNGLEFAADYNLTGTVEQSFANMVVIRLNNDLILTSGDHVIIDFEAYKS